MRSVLKLLLTSTVLCAGLLTACLGTGDEMLEEVRNEIAQELRVGDDAGKIEAFLRSKRRHFELDRYSGGLRYRSIIRNVGHDDIGTKSIQVFIYVDDQKRFVSAEVVGIYERAL